MYQRFRLAGAPTRRATTLSLTLPQPLPEKIRALSRMPVEPSDEATLQWGAMRIGALYAGPNVKFYLDLEYRQNKDTPSSIYLCLVLPRSMKITVADVTPGLVQHAVDVLARKIVSQPLRTVHFPHQQLTLETTQETHGAFRGRVYDVDNHCKYNLRKSSADSFQEALREILIYICTSELAG